MAEQLDNDDSANQRAQNLALRFASASARFASASACGVFLSMATILSVPFSAIYIKDAIAFFGFPEGLAALCLLLLPFYCGVALGRFLIRALPPYASGKVRGRATALTVAFMFLPASYPIVFLFLLWTSNPADWSARGKSELPTSSIISQDSLFIASLIGALLLCETAVFLTYYVRHRKPRAFLDHPFVLFLRRFSTFSDRAITNLALKQAAPDKPIVFLTPGRSGAGDWNPLLVGFAGLKLRHPVRSLPIILSASDDEWEQAAEELIHRAELIVIDVSERSSAIAAEIDLIRKAAQWRNTLCLREQVQATRAKTNWKKVMRSGVLLRLIFPLVLGLILLPLASRFMTQKFGSFPGSAFVHLLIAGILYYRFIVRPILRREAREEFQVSSFDVEDIEAQSARVICYERSWIRALPRLILGFLLLFVLPVFSPFMLFATAMKVGGIGGRGLFLLIAWGGTAWIYYSFFVLPAINREAKRALRRALRGR